jgi:probable F420-dependent oxidoreductase
MKPDDPLLEPLVHLAYVAALTERMLVATGVVLLPQRQPVLLAKQAASLDALSGGRFMLTVGAGHIPEELAAFGVQMSERGRRIDESIAAMRTMWYDQAPFSYEGRFVSFAGLDAQPRPISQIPIIIGGRSPAAFKRAATKGNGWYGFNYDPEGAAAAIREIHEAVERHGRPDGLGPLEITMTPKGPLTQDDVEAFAAAGVDRLVVHPLPLEDESAIVDYLQREAAIVLG